jgi:hypothetical protein
MLLPMLTLQVLAKKVRNYHFAADRLRMVAASASLKDSAEFQGRDLKRICMETLLSPELGLCDATVEVMRVWLSLYKASTEMQVGRSVGRSVPLWSHDAWFELLRESCFHSCGAEPA